MLANTAVQFYRKPSNNGTQKMGLDENRCPDTPKLSMPAENLG